MLNHLEFYRQLVENSIQTAEQEVKLVWKIATCFAILPSPHTDIFIGNYLADAIWALEIIPHRMGVAIVVK